MNLSTALAKPSSSFEVVTRRAARLTSVLALPIAMLRPECANISTSLGMSPIVAMSSGLMLVLGRQVLGHLALVRLRVGDVQVVGLRGSRRDMVAELVMRGNRWPWRQRLCRR